LANALLFRLPLLELRLSTLPNTKSFVASPLRPTSPKAVLNSSTSTVPLPFLQTIFTEQPTVFQSEQLTQAQLDEAVGRDAHPSLADNFIHASDNV
jgi:hypothetical protein